MEVDLTINYHTPEDEFTMLSKKYPTGHYKESDGTWWFTLIIDDVKLVWFKE